MKVKCNLADESCVCSHAKPHRLTSTKGREPRFGRCQDGFCYTKNKPCECVEVKQENE